MTCHRTSSRARRTEEVLLNVARIRGDSDRQDALRRIRASNRKQLSMSGNKCRNVLDTGSTHLPLLCKDVTRPVVCGRFHFHPVFLIRFPILLFFGERAQILSEYLDLYRFGGGHRDVRGTEREATGNLRGLVMTVLDFFSRSLLRVYPPRSHVTKMV
jgi:hypothetical protein